MIRNFEKKSSPKQRPAIKTQISEIETAATFLDKTHLQFWFLVLFSFAIYANTLSLDYALDDALMITNNGFTKKGFSGFREIM